MKSIRAIAVLLVMIMTTFVFTACSTTKNTEPQTGNLDFEEVEIGSIDDNTVKQWYEENSKSEGIFSVDSNDNRYLLVGAGQKPTGGYDVEIVSVVGEKDKVVVNAKVNTPEEGEMVTEALTYPNTLVKIQKDSRDIVLGDFDNPTVEEAKEPSYDLIEETGVYVGLMDSNSCEIEVNGVATPFRLSEDVKPVFNDINANDKVKFSYYKNEYEQLVITQIEKVRSE